MTTKPTTEKTDKIPTDVAVALGRRIIAIGAKRKAIAEEREQLTTSHREILDRLAQLTQADAELSDALAEAVR